MEGKAPREVDGGGFAPVTEHRAELGESPVWSAEDDAIWWVDVEGRKLFRTRLGGATEAWSAPERAGFVQLAASGTPVVGMESGLFAFDAARGAFELILPLPGEGVRFNDACVDGVGRLWAGTMDIENRRPAGTLLRIDPDGTTTRVLDGFLTINGLAWDGARERLYVSDSHLSVRAIWRMEAPGGALAPGTRRVFARTDDLPGRPDGAALDATGGYWIAGIGGGELYRFDPRGRLTHRIAIPVEHPTKIAFGGPGLGRLFLTSKIDSGAGGRLAVWDGVSALGFGGVATARWGWNMPPSANGS